MTAEIITITLILITAFIFLLKDKIFLNRKYNRNITVELTVVTVILIFINLYPCKFILNKELITITLQMIFAGIIEEIIFRVYLYKFFEKFRDCKHAVIYSSLIFGLIHIVNISNISITFTILQILCAVGMGLLYSIAYYKTGNIIIPIVSHILINISYTLGGSVSVYKEVIFTVIVTAVSAFEIYTTFYRLTDIKYKS